MSEPGAPATLVGALEDRYRIERELGAGGMATVYLAEDLKHARHVAIKVLKPELAASVGAERFLREIRTTANLRHPNIVPLYDSGEAGGFLYYVMPYVEGESLGDRLRRETQLPVEEALRLTREVAEALGHAHARGVIHRDIKPGNVMLEAGHAVVTDFGIASAVSVAGGARLTQTGMIVGTPAYMSPEQGMGQGEVDARSDLYSLACVLYEMLAGVPPFTGPTAAVVIARHTLDTPPPLSTARPGLPGHIAAAVERALSKTPADRFETAERWVEALTAAPADGAASRPAARRGAGPAAPSASDLALAVLPFQSPEDPAMQALAEGLAEDITAGLTLFPHLVLVAGAASVAETDVRKVAERLGARYVLRGQLRRSGDAIRLSVRVVDAPSGRHLWSERYDRDLSAGGAFEIQDDLVERVVATVADGYGALVRAMCARLEGKDENRFSAPEWVLRHYDYLQRITPEAHARFRDSLERAVEREPRRPELQACLSIVCLHEEAFGFNTRPGALDRALAAARRAVDLDRTSQLGYQMLAQAHFFRRDQGAFRPAADRAMALNPRDSNTLAILGLQLVHIGDYERGADICRRAMAMNPHHAGWYHFGPLWEHFHAGDYEKALARANQVNMPGQFWQPLAIAACNAYLGRRRQAEAAIRDLLAIDPDFGRHARKNIESWHYASGLLDPLIEGLVNAGLDIPDDGSGPVAGPRAASSEGGSPAAPPDGGSLAASSERASPSPSAAGHMGPSAAAAPPGMADRARDTSPRSPGASDRARTSPGSPGADGAPRSLAVLPLANLSGDPGQEFFVAGMHDAILSELARIGALTVISRTSVLRFKDTEEPLPDIARQLGVEAVIEGSVLRAGDRVRITLQLIQATPEKHLWGESYERDLTDVLALHGEVAHSVAGAITARLTPAEEEKLTQAARVDPEVYDLYLRGSYLNQWVTEEARRAVEYLERVVELAPDFAPAHAGLARRYVWLSSLGVEPGIDVLARAAAAAERAHELDPESGEALAMVGYLQFVKDWDSEGARRKLARAVELEPGNVAVLLDAAFQRAILGEWEEADRILVRALELDPFNAQAAFTRGWSRMMARRYEEAIEILEAAFEVHPTFAYIPQWTAFSYARLGQPERALEWARVADRIDPDSVILDFLAVLGQVYAMAGEPDEARRIQKRVETLAAGEGGAWFRWTIPLALGEMDTAYEGLVQSFEERNPFLVLLPIHPIFDPARAEPRMAKLIQGMDLIPGLEIPAASEAAAGSTDAEPSDAGPTDVEPTDAEPGDAAAADAAPSDVEPADAG